MTRKQELITDYASRGIILLAAGDSESDKPMLTAATHRIVIGDSLAHEWQGERNTLALTSGDLDQNQTRMLDFFLHSMEAQ